MLVLRVVKSHDRRFMLRLSDWVMAAMMTNMGLLFLTTPGMFDRSPVFSGVSLLLDEWVGGLACAIVGSARLAALVIFTAFLSLWRTASIVRAVLAMATALVWLQLAIGFWMSGAIENAGIGKVIYPWLVVFEVMNTVIAATDAGEGCNDGHSGRP